MSNREVKILQCNLGLELNHIKDNKEVAEHIQKYYNENCLNYNLKLFAKAVLKLYGNSKINEHYVLNYLNLE
jgi:sulfur relay (sulfurtransferase) DsrC/TusE family protein